MQWMNCKSGRLNFLTWFLIGLAAGGLVPGCTTRTAQSTQSGGHEGETGFYQAFTNHAGSPLSKPTGPFAAGRVERLFTDKSRDILYRTVTNG